MSDEALEHIDVRLFQKSWIERDLLRQVLELAGPLRGKTALCLNGRGAGLAHALCGGEGTWHSAHRDAETAAVLRIRDGDRAQISASPKLPFADGFFDVVVLLDYLEHEPDTRTLIAECHRALKKSGRLILTARQAKRWSLVRGLQRVLGLSDPGRERPAYTDAGLFDLLKDGFDMDGVRTSSRFFTEFTESWIEWLILYRASRTGPAAAAVAESALSVRAWSYPVQQAAAALDRLLFFAEGYNLILRAKRRIWSPRRIPVLKDGRSISEAAINTRIGTARPF
jgi:SAM-dependent methyltransferase